VWIEDANSGEHDPVPSHSGSYTATIQLTSNNGANPTSVAVTLIVF
jgi:hypothetical protein